ncbi:MAG: glycosyltransferase family 2 protein [Ethanoligenens sp.]
MKLLSIAVPSYNVEDTLEATLRSLCLPELLPVLDIIVVDDGSTDGTAKLANTFAKRYPDSVRVISQQNKGHGGAVNTGVAAALGRYFKVVDGDDTLAADGFARLLTCLHTSQADLVLAHYEKVPANDPAHPVPMRFKGVEFGRVYPFAELPLDSGLYFGIHSITIRTDILRRNDILLQEHTFYVDVEYGLLPVPYIQTVAFLDDIVYRYAVGRATQSIAVDSFVRRYGDHERVVKRMVGFVRQTALDEARAAYAYTVLKKLCFTQYMIAAFYDPDFKRGGWRARRFDAWLKKADAKLYDMMAENTYLRLLRRTRFLFLRTAFSKALMNRAYRLLNILFQNKRKFTY